MVRRSDFDSSVALPPEVSAIRKSIEFIEDQLADFSDVYLEQANIFGSPRIGVGGFGAVRLRRQQRPIPDERLSPSAAADHFSIVADLTPVPALPMAGAVALAVLFAGRRRAPLGGELTQTRGDSPYAPALSPLTLTPAATPSDGGPARQLVDGPASWVGR